MPVRRPDSPVAPVRKCTAGVPSLSLQGRAGEGGDVLGGAVRTGSLRLPCGRAEPARGGTPLWPSSQHRAQNADLLGTPGYRRTKPLSRPKLDAVTAIIDQILEADR